VGRTTVLVALLRGGVLLEEPGLVCQYGPPGVLAGARTVHPDLERFLSDRMGATTFDVDSSHVPMLSNPDFVLGVIREAASAI
jgi:hypothetical protein